MKISYDSTFLYQSNGVTHGISSQTDQANEQQIKHAIERVDQSIQEKKYGFINILQDQAVLREIRLVYSSLRWAKTLVVVGIGGSDLGARALQNALEVELPPMDVIFHGDSTDPTAITRLMRLIDLEETVFCIISKSGETIETISQYVFFKNVMKKQKEDWAEHFLFITDKSKGILRKEADKFGILTVSIPDDVGGRFSVQTSVGLIPALAMGIDVDQFLLGAADFAKDLSEISSEIAKTQFLLYQQGLKVNVLMPYSTQLQEFGRWYRQLWAESLGKDGKGILPIKAFGPADQHSQNQFYMEGSLLHSLLFIKVAEREDDYPIEDVDVEGVEYLEGHSFHEILNAEQEASALALRKLGRPSATITIEKLNAYSLGQLTMMFELAVVYLAEMLEVNAFDQPGVEEGKQMMYALLGREGFEEKKKEIEKMKA